jgi:hypothetical protein
MTKNYKGSDYTKRNGTWYHYGTTRKAPIAVQVALDKAAKDGAHSTTFDGRELRSQFKEAYYGIGDHACALEQLDFDLEPGAAKTELAAIMLAVFKAQKELKAWADKQLPNWD